MVPEWFDDKWMAAFFDGEGCVHSQITKTGRVVPRITIAQRKPEVIHILHEYLGMGSVGGNGRNRSGRESLRISITGRNHVGEFVRRVYPYSIVKKDQLKVAWKLLKAEDEEAIKLHFELSRLKHIP